IRPSISAFLPAPSIIVVLSLSTTIRLALPRSASVMLSSLMPSSSAITLPPVRIPISSSIALRRSPKPGALTAVHARVRRQVSAVELHTLDHFERGLESLGLLDRDHAFLADLFHRLGDNVADGRVVIGGNRTDLRDFTAILGRLRQVLELVHDALDGAFDAAFERHRIVAGGDHLDTFGVDRTGKHGRGSGAVTGNVRGL